MNPGRLAFVASLVAAASWAAKAVAIGLAGGLDRSPLEGPLFLLGLVSALTAAASAGIALVGARSRVLAVVSGIGGVLALLLPVGLAAEVIRSLQPAEPGWVWGEMNLWFGALLLLAAGCCVRDRRPRRSDAPAATSVATR